MLKTLYNAISLNGKIAKFDDSTDFLSREEIKEFEKTALEF